MHTFLAFGMPPCLSWEIAGCKRIGSPWTLALSGKRPQSHSLRAFPGARGCVRCSCPGNHAIPSRDWGSVCACAKGQRLSKS